MFDSESQSPPNVAGVIRKNMRTLDQSSVCLFGTSFSRFEVIVLKLWIWPELGPNQRRIQQPELVLERESMVCKGEVEAL